MNIRNMNLMAIIIFFISLLVIVILLQTSFASSLNKHVIFHPYKPSKEYYDDIIEEYKDNLVQFNVTTPDNVKLDCFLFKYDGKPSFDDGNIFIFFHGNAGWIGKNLNRTSTHILSKHGSIVLVDYRGYGMSEGSPSDKGLYIDAYTVWSHLINEKNIDPKKIVIYGHSLGSSVASNLIKELCIKSDELPRGLILEAPFTSIENIAGEMHPIFKYLVTMKFNNDKNLKKICEQDIPICILHSVADEVIPYNHAETLKLCANKVNLIQIEGTHTNPIFTDKSLKAIKDICVEISNEKI